jgi:LysR family glycine cleavage system transcriptional activator
MSLLFQCPLYLPEPSNDPASLTLFEEAQVPVRAPGLSDLAHPLDSVDDLARFALLHRSAGGQWREVDGGSPSHPL